MSFSAQLILIILALEISEVSLRTLNTPRFLSESPLREPIPILSLSSGNISKKSGFEFTSKDLQDLHSSQNKKFSFFERIRNSYLDLARENSHRIFTIDAAQNESEVFNLAKECIEKNINEN